MKNILKELKLINFNDNFDILAFRLREAFKYSLEINQTFDIENINLVTDEDGKITFRKYLLQNGCYMIKVPRYSEVLKGYDMGEFYEIVSHNYSLTWLHSKK